MEFAIEFAIYRTSFISLPANSSVISVQYVPVRLTSVVIAKYRNWTANQQIANFLRNSLLIFNILIKLILLKTIFLILLNILLLCFIYKFFLYFFVSWIDTSRCQHYMLDAWTLVGLLPRSRKVAAVVLLYRKLLHWRTAVAVWLRATTPR